MNKVILIGNLTKDPDLKKTTSGKAVAQMTIAVNRPSNEKEADFFNVIVWEKLAENCAKYLSKGKKACVIGRIQNRTYEKDEKKNYITEIIASEIEFLSPAHATANADTVDDDLPF